MGMMQNMHMLIIITFLNMHLKIWKRLLEGLFFFFAHLPFQQTVFIFIQLLTCMVEIKSKISSLFLHHQQAEMLPYWVKFQVHNMFIISNRSSHSIVKIIITIIILLLLLLILSSSSQVLWILYMYIAVHICLNLTKFTCIKGDCIYGTIITKEKPKSQSSHLWSVR